MKRMILTAVLLLLMAVVMAACAGPVGPQGPPGLLNYYWWSNWYYQNSGSWLVLYSGTETCADENDIAAMGYVSTTTADCYTLTQDQTFQDPNYPSYQRGEYICDCVFGCGVLDFTVYVQCLSVP